MAVILAVAVGAAVVAAAAAGASAYMQSEEAAQQRKAQKRVAQFQAEQEQAAGAARRKQVEYDAKKKAAGIRTRQAAAGVQIGQGSLLETEMAYAADAEYAAQLAQFGYEQSAAAHIYESRIYGREAKRIKSQQGLTTGIAAGGSAASSGSTIATGYYSRPTSAGSSNTGSWT